MTFARIKKHDNMSTVRQEKVSRLIQKEIGDIFQKESSSFSPGALVSVTSVRVSPDFSYAKIYLSILGTSAISKEDVYKNIKEKSLLVRKLLGNRVKNVLRIVPDLDFFIDDSVDYYTKINELLKK